MSNKGVQCFACEGVGYFGEKRDEVFCKKCGGSGAYCGKGMRDDYRDYADYDDYSDDWSEEYAYESEQRDTDFEELKRSLKQNTKEYQQTKNTITSNGNKKFEEGYCSKKKI